MLRIIQAQSPGDLKSIRDLFQEYANSVKTLFCFPDFDKELTRLPGAYSPPNGRLLLALYDCKPVGCVALAQTGKDVCEMKRLYVTPKFRDHGVGGALLTAILTEAEKIGYKTMRLDTLLSFKEAVALYRSKGFKEIGPCAYSRVKGAITMEKKVAVNDSAENMDP